MNAAGPILVFGAGQLGTFAARAIAETGARVDVADLAPDQAFFARYGLRSAPPVERVDITGAADVDRFVGARPDARAVVLVAGLTGANAVANPALARRVAELGAANVLSAARRVGIRRVVAVSSLAVYSHIDSGASLDSGAPLDERSLTEPRTVYGMILRDFEKATQRASGEMQTIVLRVAGAFGPNRFHYGSHSSRFVERVLYASALGDAVNIEGFWEDEDDIVYVKDIARAVAAAATAPSTKSMTLNVGMGRTSSVGQIAAAVRALFAQSDINVVPPMPPRQPLRRVAIDVRRLASALDVRPAFSLAAALQDYASEAGLLDNA